MYGSNEVGWGYRGNFVWSHGVNLPGEDDLSQLYPSLKSFFVERLEIPEFTMKGVQEQLLKVAANAPAVETFTLLSYLNTLVQNMDQRMDPEEFVSKPIFPILTPSSQLKRVRGDIDLCIVDGMRLFNLFRDKANMLAFTRSQVMSLKALFKWLGMEHMYLTRKASYNVDWPEDRDPREIEWDIGQKAEALLQIAAYFRSPLTESIEARDKLLRALREAKMMEVDDMFSETKLISIDSSGHHCSGDDPVTVISDTYPQLKLSTSFGYGWDRVTGRLVAHVPADKKQQQLATAVALPRLLMKWLLTPFNNIGWDDVVDIPDLGVSLVKSVLSTPPDLANAILEAEGIEQPLIPREYESTPITEECLDKMEVQEEKAPAPSTPTPTTPAPAIQTPVLKAPVTEAPKTDNKEHLREAAAKSLMTEAPKSETAKVDVPERKILIPRGPKPRFNAEGVEVLDPSHPFKFEKTIRNKDDLEEEASSSESIA
ncbi:hypothetical protein IL306_007906 [Fusarium sp. DS 682]|nr:hypothetical protein IL306_007906 [Fusarium sp. DS 682]